MVRTLATLVAKQVAATDTNLRMWVRSSTDTLTALARFQKEEFCQRLVARFAPDPQVEIISFILLSKCGHLFSICGPQIVGPSQALIL